MSFGVGTIGSGFGSALLGSVGDDVQSILRKVLAESANEFGLDIGKLAKGPAQAAEINRPAADEAFAAVNAKLSPVEQGQLLAAKDKAFGPPAAGASVTVASARATRARPSTAADLAIAKSPAAAPKTIRFSDANQKVFDKLWSQSLPGGRSKEQGGTLTFDRKAGSVGIQNVGGLGSTSRTFSPNERLKDPNADGVLGTFHTHPYDKTEGGYTGVSLSGGDAAYMINGKQSLSIVQSGSRQFMYMRTAQTPAHVDHSALNNAQNARISTLMAKGLDFAGASRQAASETATKYHLAYYEGSHGTLHRVNPN